MQPVFAKVITAKPVMQTMVIMSWAAVNQATHTEPGFVLHCSPLRARRVSKRLRRLSSGGQTTATNSLMTHTSTTTTHTVCGTNAVGLFLHLCSADGQARVVVRLPQASRSAAVCACVPCQQQCCTLVNLGHYSGWYIA